jgi:cation diffusion facilitator CzcD-associated flavoprotein CzcO
VIVGAGISGIAMGHRLLKAGVEHLTVLEKAPSVGGTWWYNRYPGASCDFNAHHYSFSFMRNPDFSGTNPPAAELNAYLDNVVDAIGLRPHIKLRAMSTSRPSSARPTSGSR